MIRPYRKLPVLSPQDKQRFHSHPKKGNPGECWEWQGGRTVAGYGRFYVRQKHKGEEGQTLLAHRVAYYLHYGTDPGELLVCHTCDNPPCTNPSHLFLGTDEMNFADMRSKGRHRAGYLKRDTTKAAKGNSLPQSKLTPALVREIRARYSTGIISLYALGKEYGVDTNTIRPVVLRLTWKHVD